MDPRSQWIFYVSRVAHGVGEPEVDQIVQAAQARNQRHGLTGALLFTGSHFAQVLEGEPAQMEPVVRSILGDPRHVRIRVLGREPLVRRRFRQWSLRLVTQAGRADLIEDLLEAPEVSIERARRLVTGLFRFTPDRR